MKMWNFVLTNMVRWGEISKSEKKLVERMSDENVNLVLL